MKRRDKGEMEKGKSGHQTASAKRVGQVYGD